MSVLASKVKTIWSDVCNCENAHNADGVEQFRPGEFFCAAKEFCESELDQEKVAW